MSGDGPKRDRFNWRPMATAPHDGTAFVTLTITTYVGGEHRPIDAVPNVELVHRAGDSASGGYWRSGPAGSRRGSSRGDRDLAGGWWTTVEEYTAAIPGPEATWHNAPNFVREFVCCPLVFVRPTRRACAPEFAQELGLEYGPVLAAEVVWPHGNTGAAPERWSSAKCQRLEGINSGYLDGGPFGACEAPFRWMMLSEFFPAEFFAHEIEEEMRMSALRIDAWRRRAAAPRPTPCDHVDWFFDGQLTYRLRREFEHHLPGCERCRRVLEGRMQEAAVVAASETPPRAS